MDKMKNAFERAMERVTSLGDATSEDKLRFSWEPKGRKKASEFLNGEGNLTEFVETCDEETRYLVIEGIKQVLINNIVLPEDEAQMKRITKSIEGLEQTIPNNPSLKEILERINYIVSSLLSYRQDKLKEVYEQFKTRFESTVRETLQQQGQGNIQPDMPLNVEAMPQFGQEWNKVRMQFESQYQATLDEQKKLLQDIS